MARPRWFLFAQANAQSAAVDDHRPSFAIADVAARPFTDSSFDVVVSTMSMHHWDDPQAGLAEISRVLRPGDRALVWDLRPGIIPIHRHMPDVVEHARRSPLRVVTTPWRWPWRLKLSQRIELVRARPARATNRPAERGLTRQRSNADGL
jgi:SAM-dependent methyltransferase